MILFICLFLIQTISCQELLTDNRQTQSVEVYQSKLRKDDWKPHKSEPLIYDADKEFRDETKLNEGEVKQTEKRCAQLSMFVPNLCRNEHARKKCSICKTFPSEDFIDCGKREPKGLSIEKMREDRLMGHLSKSSSRRRHKKSLFRKRRGPDKNPYTLNDPLHDKGHARIVGGQECHPGEWPWQVSIFRGDKEQFCGGAILSKDFVLTASHIFGNGWTYPEDWSIVAGDHWRTENKDPNARRHQVKKILHHKDFFENFEAHLEKVEIYYSKYDIAILQLNESIEIYHENKASICLPDDYHPIRSWHSCFITGWGKTKFKGETPETLQKCAIEIMPHDKCNSPEVYNNTIDESTLCAGFDEPGRGTCNGDSGGSMVCYVEGRWYSTGIVSGGYKCGEAKFAPSIFANVTYLKQWIISTILNHADDVT